MTRVFNGVAMGRRRRPLIIAAASNSPSLPLIHHDLFLGIILCLCKDFGVEKFF